MPRAMEEYFRKDEHKKYTSFPRFQFIVEGGVKVL